MTKRYEVHGDEMKAEEPVKPEASTGTKPKPIIEQRTVTVESDDGKLKVEIKND
jgi:hypothetical protein